MSPAHVKEYNSVAKELLWQDSTPKVQKKRLTQPIARGGIGLTDIEAFSTSLRTRWYRQLINIRKPTEDGNDQDGLENWMIVLRYWIGQVRLNLTDIPRLGWMDLNILGQKLANMGCHYWGNTFRRYAEIVRIWEVKNDNITALPLFGGLCQQHANRHKTKWMSIFDPTGECLAIFQKYKTVGDLFHAQRTIRQGRQDENRVDLTSPRTADEEFPFTPRQDPDNQLRKTRKRFNALVKAIKKAVCKLPQIMEANDAINPVKVEDTALILKCKQHARGSSFTYHSMITNIAEKHDIETAPAFHTWENDLNHGMTEREWFNALKGVARVHVSPKARWLAIQIFYRQFYTPMKKYNSTEVIEDGEFPGCSDFWPCHTRHLFYHCSGVAKTVWEFTNMVLSRSLNKTVEITRNMALFHQDLSNDAIIATVMASKYAIRRIALKVNPPIHARVAIAFLKTQLLSTANTYLRAGKDTNTWTAIARETTWLQQEWTHPPARRRT